MNIIEMIVKGNEKAGSQKNLAELLGVSSQNIANTKKGRYGLPDYACFRLAELLQIDPATVIAASALVTEKNEERRKTFLPFVIGKAATIAALSMGLVILEMTPTPAEAATLLDNGITEFTLCLLAWFTIKKIGLRSHAITGQLTAIFPQRFTIKTA